MAVDRELKEETLKWLEKIESERFRPAGSKGKEFEKNIKAYISDCNYFLEKNDLVRAFEAVVWAWAWIEIGREMKVLK